MTIPQKKKGATKLFQSGISNKSLLILRSRIKFKTERKNFK